MSEPLAVDGLPFDAPTPWSVVPVADGGFHLADARGHTIIVSSVVNRCGLESQRAMLERIASAVNQASDEALALARIVAQADAAGAASTRRQVASEALALAILGGRS